MTFQSGGAPPHCPWEADIDPRQGRFVVVVFVLLTTGTPRGITHDIGPAEETPAATPPVVLEQRLLDSMAEPGLYRAIINLKTLRIIRWLDDPMPGLGWEMDEHNPLPWIHDDDLPAAHALTAGLALSL